MLDYPKKLVVNQILGVAPVRRLLDRLSARPSLAPVRRDPGDIWSDPFHPELALRKFRRVQSVLADENCCRDRTVVEIGPGMSLGMGIVAIALGARRCVLADCDRYLTRDPRSAAAHRALLDLLPTWIPDADERYRHCVRIDGDQVLPDGDLLSYVIAPAERLPLASGAVDLIVSHSTLEHIVDVDAAIAELARITAPGGRGVHQVDLRDHLDAAQPLRMLQYSPRAWNLIASHRRGWSNRLRLPDYHAGFERHGFAVERMEVTESLPAGELEEMRARLQPEFRRLSAEALQALGFRCAVRKRVAS